MRQVIALGLALIATACGETSTTSGASSPTGASSTTPPATTAAPATAAAAAPVAVQTKDRVGSVLTTSTGMTLYYFTPDARSAVPTCTGGCAATWPPLTSGAPSTPISGAPGTFGTVARADGSAQLTYNGWPLYTYTLDKDSGDVYGEGVGGKWFAARVTVTRTGAAASTPASAPASAGY